MVLKRLEQQGSGVVLRVNKERVLQLAPEVYQNTWEAILKGKGEYALILGAGTAEREVFFGLEGQDLIQCQLPKIHCYDKSNKPPSQFIERRKQFSDVEIEYFPNSDLNSYQYQLPLEYKGKTRLISMHGFLDYLSPEAIVNLMKQVKEITPQALSFRLCLAKGNFFRDFAADEQLRREQKSIENLKNNLIFPISSNQFRRTGIIQIPLSKQHRLDHNLESDYAASCIMPDKLAGFFLNEGYKTSAVEEYSDDMNSNLLFFMEKR